MVLTDPAALTGQLPLMASLACQCFNNEYIYPTTPNEESSLDLLRRRISEAVLARDNTRLLPQVAVYGMYRSLCGLDCSWGLLGLDGELEEVIQRQIAEPIEEDRLKGKIRSFGSVTDPISQDVRQQYEDFPYPRWFNFTMGRQTTFSESIARKGKLRQARRAIIETMGPIDCFEFFHLSGLPDAFCPVHAKHFAPTEMYSLFGELDVEFLGYPDLREDLLAIYRQRFPHDPHIRDLHSIDLFEHPKTFWGLPSFYLRKKAAYVRRSSNTHA